MGKTWEQKVDAVIYVTMSKILDDDDDEAFDPKKVLQELVDSEGLIDFVTIEVNSDSIDYDPEWAREKQED